MSAKDGEPQDIREILDGLPVEELRAVLLSAVDRHPDVERHVRLVVARASGDLVQLRGEVDRGVADAAISRLPREPGVGACGAADRR